MPSALKISSEPFYALLKVGFSKVSRPGGGSYLKRAKAFTRFAGRYATAENTRLNS